MIYVIYPQIAICYYISNNNLITHMLKTSMTIIIEHSAIPHCVAYIFDSLIIRMLKAKKENN